MFKVMFKTMLEIMFKARFKTIAVMLLVFLSGCNSVSGCNDQCGERKASGTLDSGTLESSSLASGTLDSGKLDSSSLDSGTLTLLEESLSAWNSTQGNKNYQYTIMTSSWAGYASKTIIHVANGQIVKREYHALNNEPNNSELGLELDNAGTGHWVENTQASLGSHQEGAPLKTLETLYDECHVILSEKDNDDNSVTFSTDKNNVLRQCFYVPKNCADDCSFGVAIHELKINRLKE